MLSADSRDEARNKKNDSLMDHSSLLDFADTDVSEVDVECEEVCGSVCEVCSNACEMCGDCIQATNTMRGWTITPMAGCR